MYFMWTRSLSDFLVVYLMPFCYGAATRLPFIYYVIHLDSHFGAQIIELFGSKWLPIGFFVGAYQFCRVLTNLVALRAPRISHVLGTALGFAGYALVLVTDKDVLATFVTGTVLIGFSETFSALQIYVKQIYSDSLDELQFMLKVQYAAVMTGVTFAFLLGGIVYQHLNIDGVAGFGMIVLGAELICIGYLSRTQMPSASTIIAVTSISGASWLHQSGASKQHESVSEPPGTSSTSRSSSRSSSKQHESVIEPPGSDVVQQDSLQTSTTSSSVAEPQETVGDIDRLAVGDIGPPPRSMLAGSKAVDNEVLVQELPQRELSEGRRISESSPVSPRRLSGCSQISVLSQIPPRRHSQISMISQRLSQRLSLGGSSLVSFESAMQELSPLDLVDTFSKTGHPPNVIAYLIAVTIGVQAIANGYNLSVGPIFLLVEFGADTSMIGILFAVGASMGTLTSMAIALSPLGRRLMQRYVPTPYNVYAAMIGIGCSVLLMTVPILAVHITGLLLLLGFNDFAVTLLLELQGSITSIVAYQKVGPISQVVRRCGNVLTAITGPVLFSLWPRAPHLVAGFITLTWTAGLVFALEKRRRHVMRALQMYLTASTFNDVMGLPWEAKEILCQSAESAE